MSRPVRVMIVEDQVLMRQGLKTLLGLDSRVEVVSESADGVDALEKIPAATPDVALVDVRMPRMDGVEFIRRLSGEYPEVAALILTTFDDDEYIFDGLRAGAKGYLLKDAPSDEIVVAIEKAHRGEGVLDGSIAAKVISEFRRLGVAPSRASGESPLSEREVEVLRFLASGSSNREISRRLRITEGTVKNHISNILHKLELRDRTQAALYAAERGWIARR